jgi:MFS family permease
VPRAASARSSRSRRSFAIPADILPKTVAGGAVALINSLGALGGFLGSYLVGWFNGVTDDPSSSFLLMGLSLTIAVVLLLLPVAPSQPSS